MSIIKLDLPEAKYVEMKRTTGKGIEYTKYKLVYPPNPLGFNHQDRRNLDAMNKRMESGRRLIKHGKRIW